MYGTQAHQESQILMGIWHTNHRSSRRSFVVCPITIESESGRAHGIVRDISAGGIFFYSNFRPVLHTNVNFVVQLKGRIIRGKGEIVRVQESTPGAAIGIAIKISD
jgi:hypothetical protein